MHIVGQEVEVVLSVDENLESFRMMRKKGPSARKLELSLVYLVTCPPRWGARQRGDAAPAA